jgi:hypothetical protein
MPRAPGFPGSRRYSARPGIAGRASPASTRTTMRGSGSLPRGRQPPRVPQSRSPLRQTLITPRAFVPSYASSPPSRHECSKSRRALSRREPSAGDLATRQLGNWAGKARPGPGRTKLPSRPVAKLPSSPVAKLPSGPVAEAPRQPSTPRVRVATITSVAAAKTGRRTTSAEAAQARHCSPRNSRSSEPSSGTADRLRAARSRSAHSSADSSKW